MNGKYVSRNGTDSVVLGHEGGKPNTTHAVSPDCKVTLNGKPAKLTDLKAGDDVGIGDETPATMLTTTRK